MRVSLRRWESPPPNSPSPPPTSPHQEIGHYQLLEKIGEGGFGLVWRAWQTAPVQRHVALKIIKLGLDSEQVVARFNTERQTLAMMDHPSIASVHDAGTTESGRPYFVMELVDGPPLNEYCDQHRLSLRERLQLFIKVCRGIQHAHQKGVLHRDLKPGNILVTLEDHQPRPKIIDFGVCRALDSTLTPHSGSFHTRADLLLGTPEYMSPEQAILGNPDLDTRSDLYSLGAVLYELLLGRPPLQRPPGASLADVLQSVRKDEAVRPSLLAAECPPEVAAHRGTTPAGLIHLLRGDLDWIVLKALAKNREDRYESADALALDIEHHLLDLPVSAGRPGLLHSSRKFLRRHRALATAIVIVAVGLLAGTLFSTYAYIRESEARLEADQQRQQAEAHEAEALRQRDLALRESNKAGQTLAFLNRLLEETGTQASQGKNPEALRLALDQLLSHDLAQFSDNPEVQEAVAGRAAMIYRALRDEGKSLPLIERQVQLLEKSLAPNDTELLSARENYARTLYLNGRLIDSQQQYDLLVQGWQSRLNTRDGARRLFIARRNRVDIWFRSGRLQESLAEMADIKAHATDEMRQHSSWPVLERNHAEMLTEAGRWAEAEAIYQDTLARLDLADPEQIHSASMLHSKRSSLCLRQKNVPGAIAALERAIELQTQAKGTLSPWLPEWYIEVSRLYTARNQNDKAVAASRTALDITAKTAQSNRLHIAHRALGDNLEAAGRFEEAAKAYGAASLLEKAMLPSPPEAWVDHAFQMRNLARSGHLDEARQLAQELDPILVAWQGDPGRARDVRVIEANLLFTRLTLAAKTPNASNAQELQVAERLARPILERFLSKSSSNASTPALQAAAKILAQPHEPAFQSSRLTAADALAFERATNDRWSSGDVGAALMELASALRLCGRHQEAVQVYLLVGSEKPTDLPVLDRHHHAHVLAAETLAQSGDQRAAQELLDQLRRKHEFGTDPVTNPQVRSVLNLSLSPSAP